MLDVQLTTTEHSVPHAISMSLTDCMPTEEHQPQVDQWAYFMINNFITFLIISENTVTVFLIWRYKYLRTITNCYALSLAMADLIMGCIYPLYNTLNYTSFADWLVEETYACAVCLYFILISAGVSLLTLLAISVDRYIAVLKPHYGKSKPFSDNWLHRRLCIQFHFFQI